MISCGEPSGDLYAGALASEISQLDPGVDIVGLGGEHLRQAGGRLIADYRGLSVTGLSEAISVLPRSLALYRKLVTAARLDRPDVLVAIDFPDFNFRLAAALKRLGVPIVYYIGPQLWAWRPGRLRTMKRLVDRVLVIFPFEEAIYRNAGVPVEFVGHPLVDLATAREPRESFLRALGLDPARRTIALLPGSRPNEVRGILPGLVHAARLIAARVPSVQFVIARAPWLAESLYTPARSISVEPAPPPVVVDSRTDDVLASAELVLTASGTATVQAALHGRPMVIVYRLSWLTYSLGIRFVHVDTYGMVNLIAGERVVPELIQDDFTSEAVADEAIAFLTDAHKAARAQKALERVRIKLGPRGASRRAAAAVLAVARRQSAAGVGPSL